MKIIDLTIPLGIGTPPWPTYEPLQVKYFKRLAPNGANGQVLTHSNHLGTHLDGEASIGRCVAFVDDGEYDALMAKKAQLPKTRFGDAYEAMHVERLNQLSQS